MATFSTYIASLLDRILGAGMDEAAIDGMQISHYRRDEGHLGLLPFRMMMVCLSVCSCLRRPLPA
jgi:hypothetical protein